MDSHASLFHQIGLGSSVARGRLRPRAVRVRDKWINPDAPTWHKRRCFHGPSSTPSRKKYSRDANNMVKDNEGGSPAAGGEVGYEKARC